MIRTYQYRIYPKPGQEKKLNAMLFHAKRLYNVARLHRMWSWEVEQQSVSYADLCKIYVRDGRKVDSGFAMLPSSAAQYVIRQLDTAYKAAFRRIKAGEHAGFPKRMKYNRTLFFTYGKGFGLPFVKLSGYKTPLQTVDPGKWGRVRVFSVGEIRLRYDRPLPDGGLIGTCSLSKGIDNKWYVQLPIETPEPEEPLANENPPVGIDVGLRYALALSDGEVVEAPDFFRGEAKKLRVLQRKFQRQMRANNPLCYDEKGAWIEGKRLYNWSKRMQETKREITKLHRKIYNRRMDWAHNVTRIIADNYGYVAMENLSLEFMIRNKNLALAKSEVAIGRLRSMLRYKLEGEGGFLDDTIPAAYTSQTCSACGHVAKENRRTQENFTCVSCGMHMNADINAAINILQAAVTKREMQQ